VARRILNFPLLEFLDATDPRRIPESGTEMGSGEWEAGEMGGKTVSWHPQVISVEAAL